MPSLSDLAPALPPLLEDLSAERSAASHAETESAVLVPLLSGQGGEPKVLLTKRHTRLRRHAGELSFPGGRREAGDLTLVETALRESEEEIGLRRQDVRLVGALPATSTFVTKYAIHPFVGVIEAASSWKLSPLEVEEILELPLRQLPGSRGRTELTRHGVSFQTDVYLIADEIVWGATARILDELLQRIEPLLAIE